jgi:hypothetical protein
MTPKEKAKELFDKYAYNINFDSTYDDCIGQSKQCALIAVDEILKAVEGKYDEYWQEVKQQILNL